MLWFMSTPPRDDETRSARAGSSPSSHPGTPPPAGATASLPTEQASHGPADEAGRPAAQTNQKYDFDHARFERADLNNDGVLDAHEIRAMRLGETSLPNDPRPHGADPAPLPWHEYLEDDLPPARHHRWRHVLGRTLSKAWGDSLFGLSSQAAFWSALSTAPILLALLGFAGLIAPAFGADTIGAIQDQIDRLLHSLFNEEVANNLVGDTVSAILDQPRGDLISVGLLISLWAGSSSMSAFVEAITVAYRQHEFRNPVVERFFALGLYLIALIAGVLLLPLLALGPEYLPRLFPQEWEDNVATIIGISYYPFVLISLILLLTTLYKVAPKLKHPWKRGLPGAILAAGVFLIASFGLRLYLSYVYTHGLTYGALATPITFLLFYYLASMAIILGAQFNNALLEYFPLHPKPLRRLAAQHAKAAAKETAEQETAEQKTAGPKAAAAAGPAAQPMASDQRSVQE
jgi:membrane protein